VEVEKNNAFLMLYLGKTLFKILKISKFKPIYTLTGVIGKA
jgi:hypothetical protein